MGNLEEEKRFLEKIHDITNKIFEKILEEIKKPKIKSWLKKNKIRK